MRKRNLFIHSARHARQIFSLENILGPLLYSRECDFARVQERNGAANALPPGLAAPMSTKCFKQSFAFGSPPYPYPLFNKHTATRRRSESYIAVCGILCERELGIRSTVYASRLSATTTTTIFIPPEIPSAENPSMMRWKNIYPPLIHHFL